MCVEILLAASPYHRRWAEVEQNRSGKTEKKSSFHRGDAPALVPLVADAGVKREHILAGVRKTAAVRLADLADIRHLVGAGTQLGGQGNLVPDVQRVDLPEVAVARVVRCRLAKVIHSRPDKLSQAETGIPVRYYIVRIAVRTPSRTAVAKRRTLLICIA